MFTQYPSRTAQNWAPTPRADAPPEDVVYVATESGWRREVHAGYPFARAPEHAFKHTLREMDERFYARFPDARPAPPPPPPAPAPAQGGWAYAAGALDPAYFPGGAFYFDPACEYAAKPPQEERAEGACGCAGAPEYAAGRAGGCARREYPMETLEYPADAAYAAPAEYAPAPAEYDARAPAEYEPAPAEYGPAPAGYEPGPAPAAPYPHSVDYAEPAPYGYYEGADGRYEAAAGHYDAAGAYYSPDGSAYTGTPEYASPTTSYGPSPPAYAPAPDPAAAYSSPPAAAAPAPYPPSYAVPSQHAALPPPPAVVLSQAPRFPAYMDHLPPPPATPHPHVHPPPPPRTWRARRSPTPPRRAPDKKPPLACLFCRGRKIACGPPLPGSADNTCNQCHRRHLKCQYPLESRRGMRKKKTLNVNPDGPKVTVRRVRKTRPAE